jgi:hydantoinase/carbamoylase family amidase
MPFRRDALAGAAEIILLIERSSRAAGTPVVGTVGHLTVSPNASNVVPESVEFVFELRGPDEEQVGRLADAIVTEAGRLAAARGLGWHCEACGFVPAVTSSAGLLGVIEEVSAHRGYSSMRIYSGAGHDASHMAAIAPIGMIFVPCRDGRSHCPEEYAAPDAVLPGVDVLAHAILELDRQLP